MTFARVGAMPQPAQNAQGNMHRHNAGSASSRQKGITMEEETRNLLRPDPTMDLKKQTALRLAQEQQHTGNNGAGVYPEPSTRTRPFRPLFQHQLHGYPHTNYQQPTPDLFLEQRVCENQQAPMPETLQQSYQQPPHQNSNVHHTATGSYANFLAQKAPNFDNKGMTLRYQKHQHVQPQHSASHPGPRSPDSSRYMQDQRSRYHRATSVPNSGMHSSQSNASSEQDSSHQSGSNTAKQKLPHGLTVHELKEMTKARLQVEAEEKHEPEGYQEKASENRGVSPLDFDSLPEVRERAMSRDSLSRNHALRQHGNASDSLSSIPSMVQVNQPVRDQHLGRQPQVSPLPPGFQNYGTASNSISSTPVLGHDLRQQQPRIDAWETASVTSHNSTVFSENQGSESAFSSGFGSGILPENEMGSTPFNISRSYSAVQQGTFYEDASNPSLASASPGNSSSFFGAASSGSNRLRACTLSPGGLIHEDRPHFGGGELRMPNFSSSNSRNTILSRARNNYSPVLQLGLDPSLLGQHVGLAPLGDGFNRPRTASAVSLPPGDGTNRPRTSSAASLPPILCTGDEFVRDRANTFSGYSPGKPFARNDGLSEGSLTENFLGCPPVSHGREQPAFRESGANVFRDRAFSDGRVTAPPGFPTGSELKPVDSSPSFGYHTAFSRVGSVDGGVEADLTNTWGGDSDQAGSSIFSSGGVDVLTNDMGSILKLSGVAGRPDRERSHTYPNTSKASNDAYFTEDSVGKGFGSFRY